MRLRAVDGRWHDGDERLRCAAEGLIESRQKPVIEADTERGTRLIDQLAASSQAEPAQDCQCLCR